MEFGGAIEFLSSFLRLCDFIFDELQIIGILGKKLKVDMRLLRVLDTSYNGMNTASAVEVGNDSVANFVGLRQLRIWQGDDVLDDVAHTVVL